MVEELFARYRAWRSGSREQPRRPGVLAPRRSAAVGTDWREAAPVPDKPHIPDDHFILFTLDGALMFTNSAHIYDAVYSFKDYRPSRRDFMR